MQLVGMMPGALRTAGDGGGRSTGADWSPEHWVGASSTFEALRQRVVRAARTDFTVLIEGESGVGKELVARGIHASSPRRAGPFVALNCAAIVDTLLEAELFGIDDRVASGVRGRRGKFEEAHGGTLFLDEIADLSPHAQAKLLRALQERAVERVGGAGARTVDIRVVAATNRPLWPLVREGRFREDLYYRVASVEIEVPPLRRRAGDARLLAAHFIRSHRALGVMGITDSALDAIDVYAWPGNVRELQRAVERAIALTCGTVIDTVDLPPAVQQPYTSVLGAALVGGQSMRAWGARYARLTLRRYGGNKRRTAQVLGISYHTLVSYLRHDSCLVHASQGEED